MQGVYKERMGVCDREKRDGVERRYALKKRKGLCPKDISFMLI